LRVLLGPGEWRLDVPSRIELDVEGFDGPGPFREVAVHRRNQAGVLLQPCRYVGPEMEQMLAWPGSYTLLASGPEVCTQVQVVEVTGELTRVRLTPHAGIECTFVVEPGAASIQGPLTVSIVNDRQESVASWIEPSPTEREYNFTRRLRAGRHTAVARSRDGKETRSEFRVRETAQPGPIRINLE
jgi:hypothetical protein